MTRNPITPVVVKVKVRRQLSCRFIFHLRSLYLLTFFDNFYVILSKYIFFVSLHLSDQMSQRSEVSRIAL